ncbi:unnamed protein product, partial [Allacma fusca]
MASAVTSWVEKTSEQEKTLSTEVNGLSIGKMGGKPKEEPTAVAAETAAANNDNEEEITAAERSLLQKIIRKGLSETKSQLEVKQKDPTSPLYSAKSFEDLS